MRDRCCPLCLAATELALSEGDTLGVRADYRCQHCGTGFTIPVAVTVFEIPECIRFVDENGIDPESMTLWTVAAGFETESRLVADDSEHAVEVSLTIGDETLTLWLDDSLAVRESSRSVDS